MPGLHLQSGLLFFLSPCHPALPVRIYKCQDDNSLAERNKTTPAGQEENKMNNNMMELNMEEMEQVNGGGFFDTIKEFRKLIGGGIVDKGREIIKKIWDLF